MKYKIMILIGLCMLMVGCVSNDTPYNEELICEKYCNGEVLYSLQDGIFGSKIQCTTGNHTGLNITRKGSLKVWCE